MQVTLTSNFDVGDNVYYASDTETMYVVTSVEFNSTNHCFVYGIGNKTGTKHTNVVETRLTDFNEVIEEKEEELDNLKAELN